jgi:hypothetical protein
MSKDLTPESNDIIFYSSPDGDVRVEVFFQEETYAISNQHPGSDIEKFYLYTAGFAGHVLPGAFMSMLNISYLNESIIEKKIASSNLVFDHIREEIISSLNSEGSEEESKRRNGLNFSSL